MSPGGQGAGEQQEVECSSLSFAPQGADVLTYVDIDHRTGTAESQLYSNAEAFRCLAKPETEYTEVKKQSNKVGERRAALNLKRWVESWGGWVTVWEAGWVGWVGKGLQRDVASWGANAG